jgi:hypothetical protein
MQILLIAGKSINKKILILNTQKYLKKNSKYKETISRYYK